MVGQCAALNVPQWDYKDIYRGCTVTLGDYFSPRQWYLCNLRILPDAKSPLKNGANIKFHTGTSEVVATVFLLEGSSIAAGQESLVQVRLNRPQQIVAAPRDRFIVRSLSPVQTIGGGIIIEALMKKLKRNDEQVLQDVIDRAKAVMSERDFVEYCVKTAEDYAASETELSIRAKMLPGPLKGILAGLIGEGKALNLSPKLFIHRNTCRDVQQKLLNIVGEFHHSKPESLGMSNEQLLEASRLKKDIFDGLVQLLVSQGKFVERKHRLALPEHHETFSDDEQKLLHSIESLFKTRPFNPPSLEEVAGYTKADPERIHKIIKILIEQEQLVRVDKDLFFHREAVEQAREKLVTYITKQGGLESVKFKYLLDTTRKFAIPLLDYFDRIGVTRRSGYTRYLRASN
jgi:selenocysteine-specific elongation factor